MQKKTKILSAVSLAIVLAAAGGITVTQAALASFAAPAPAVSTDTSTTGDEASEGAEDPSDDVNGVEVEDGSNDGETNDDATETEDPSDDVNGVEVEDGTAD